MGGRHQRGNGIMVQEAVLGVQGHTAYLPWFVRAGGLLRTASKLVLVFLSFLFILICSAQSLLQRRGGVKCEGRSVHGA